MLSPHPDRRRVERWVLIYSPLWMACVSFAIFSGRLAHFSDAGYLALGIGLALPIWLPAIQSRHAFRFALWITLLSFIQNYFGSALFFDRLGMEYHFPTRFILNRVPLFLYFLTIAYFATYYVILSVALRALRRAFPSLPRAALWVCRALLCYAVAFGESFFMANDRLKPLFLYRDKQFTLLWGSLCYATLFLCTLPLYESLDETDNPTTPQMIKDLFAANLLSLILYEVYSFLIQRR